MNSFSFWNPTKIVFGAGAIRRTGTEIRELGGTKLLVLYGAGNAVKSGVLETLTHSLDEAGLRYDCAGGIRPNPRVELAQQLVDDYKSRGLDFIIGLGGGSVIDTAKAVAHGLASPGTPVWDFFCGKAAVTASLPVCAVPTIAAAGSETSDSAVMSNETLGEKRGLGTQFNRPRLAVMDPVLTYSLPDRQTACGVADIFMHTLERYFVPDADNAVTDGFAESLMRIVVKYGTEVMKNPRDPKARSELMWAGSLSHNGITGLGQTKDFSVHQMGHALSARYDLPHGESLTALWPAWARTVYRDNVGRFAQYARYVWRVTDALDAAAAMAGIEATTAYFSFLGLPVTLTEAVGALTDADIAKLADLCTYHGTRSIGSFRVLDGDAIKAIYRAAI